MHRRGFLGILTLEVLIGNGVDMFVALNLYEEPVFNTDESGEFTLALVHLRVLEQHGGLPIATRGHQGRVGVNFRLNFFFFEYFFNPEHFLNLIADRGLAFKLQIHVFPQVHRTQFAVRDDVGLVQLSVLGVSLQTHQIVNRDVARFL